MANFQGFGEMFQNVSRSVLNSALAAAQNTSNRILDPFAVQEITTRSSINEVSEYPVLLRVGSLLLYGPVPAGRFLKTVAYHIILHNSTTQKMFSMLRTDVRSEADDLFVIYKENFPLLVECDSSIFEVDKLDRMTKMLRENKGWSAPHLAAAANLQKCLKSPKMQTKLNDQEGVSLRTPLLVAIELGILESVSTLLELKADATIKDIQDNSVFHIAAANKSIAIFKLLLEQVPLQDPDLINHLNAAGFSPLYVACSSDNAEVVKELLAQNPSINDRKDLQDGGSPMQFVSGPDTLLLLLESGSDPNIVDDRGLTPLHKFVERNCLKSTLHLLCHGAFPDMKGGELDETPLHIAARLCSRVLIQILIVFGSDINVTNKNHDTPLHLLCTSQRPDKEDVQFVFSALGAQRCLQSKANSCVEGCKFSGSFNGKIPADFPNLLTKNLMHEALDSFRKQTQTVKNDRVGGGRLLCLDGGGIRGIVLTQMLVVIEQELKMPVIDLFDWVAGTSTGGILALALACKKSPLEAQCIYMRLKDKVFIGERPYSALVMEEFLKKEFGSHTTMGSIERPKVMIMTALVDRRPVDLHVFRNYISPCTLLGEVEICPQEHSTQFVWEAAKVTGAAPSYFRLDHSKFVDGGLISNNPTLDALTELQHYQTAMKSLGYIKENEKVLTTVVSLGTGIPPKTDSKASLLDITWPTGVFDAITKVPRLASLINLLIDQATQSEGQVVERARAWCSAIGTPFFRFSPQMISHVDLDEKSDEKLIELLWETRRYMVANKDRILEMKRVLLEQANPRV